MTVEDYAVIGIALIGIPFFWLLWLMLRAAFS